MRKEVVKDLAKRKDEDFGWLPFSYTDLGFIKQAGCPHYWWLLSMGLEDTATILYYEYQLSLILNIVEPSSSTYWLICK